ncbi:MAG: hypothetical protein ACRDV3_04145, partial [Acidothermaceae bacterium]
GTADAVTAWSIEAHLTSCARCRTAVTSAMDADRLMRNRSVLLVRAAMPDDGVARRAATRMGMPDYLFRLLGATPTLRLSWLLSVVGVLAVTIGGAAVAHAVSGSGGSGTGGIGVGAQHGLLPFVLVAPLLILVTVVAAFLPMFDPANRLAAAAPFSGVRLLLIRSLSALLAVAVPVVCAGFVLPGPSWVAAALLGPSLALCMLALAAATLAPPGGAAVGVGLSWFVVVLVMSQSHDPLTMVGWHAQTCSAVAVVVAAVVLFSQRKRFDLGWQR